MYKVIFIRYSFYMTKSKLKIMQVTTMSLNASYFPPVPFGHLTFLFYTDTKPQYHYISPTLYEV